MSASVLVLVMTVVVFVLPDTPGANATIQVLYKTTGDGIWGVFACFQWPWRLTLLGFNNNY